MMGSRLATTNRRAATWKTGLTLALPDVLAYHRDAIFPEQNRDERSDGQACQHELLERIDGDARRAARAPQERRASRAPRRASAREQRAGPDALVPAPG